MSRIGEMPDVDEIQNNGFLIYSDDGLYAKKITVEDFATAMGILMTNDSEVGGETGSGLVGWKEMTFDSHNDGVSGYALVGQHDKADNYICKLASLYPFSGGLDIWTSRFQRDTYDSEAPNFEGIIESKIELREEVIDPPKPAIWLWRPFVLFSLIHKLGHSLDDYISLGNNSYKILTNNIDEYVIDIFVIRTSVSPNATIEGLDFEEFINLGDGVTIVNDKLTSFGYDDGISFDVSRYRLNDIFSTEEDCIEAVAEIFNSNHTADLAGYYNEGVIIDDIIKYYDKTDYPDSNIYTYITYDDSLDYSVEYSEDGNKYTLYTDDPTVHGAPAAYDIFASVLYDIMQPEVIGGMTALTYNGLYINYPFNRKLISEKNELYEVMPYDVSDFVQTKYTDLNVVYKDRSGTRLSDIIYYNYTASGNPQGRKAYADYILNYIREHGVVTDDFITDVYLGDFLISEDGVATIRPGFGLKAVINNGKAYLAVDDTQVQKALTPGHGIAIENDTIRVIPDINDVVIGNQSVVTNRVARITLPTGLNETRLEDGDYTEIEQVSQGNGYTTYKVNVKGLENETIHSSGNYIYGPGNSTFKLMTITIPAKSSGILNYSISVNSGANTNPNNFFITSDVFDNENPSFNNPGVNPLADFTYLGEPYTIGGVTYDAITNLKATGIVVNDTYVNKNYYIYCMIIGNNRAEIYGQVEFIKDIDI